MAVKKAVKKDTTSEVEVQESPVVDTEVGDNTKEVEVETDVEVSVPEEEKEPEVEIDSKAVEDKTVVHKNVRVRANRDHRCFIGGELYDLKEGQCYNVPEFVKSVLNKAGILAPL